MPLLVNILDHMTGKYYVCPYKQILLTLFSSVASYYFASCSWELASALKESKARFDSAGVKLIAIGVGTPNKARILAEKV